MPPSQPLITTTRFVVDQEATVKCQGSLGKPENSRDMVFEIRAPMMPEFVVFDHVIVDDTQFSTTDCSFIKSFHTTVTVERFLMGLQARCRIISEIGNFTSDTVTFDMQDTGNNHFPLYNIWVRVEPDQSHSLTCSIYPYNQAPRL